MIRALLSSGETFTMPEYIPVIRTPIPPKIALSELDEFLPYSTIEYKEYEFAFKVVINTRPDYELYCYWEKDSLWNQENFRPVLLKALVDLKLL